MNQTTVERNEINEIIDLLIGYKKLIASVTIVIVLIATIYAFFIYKPIYQATALIQLAKQNTFIFEDANTLREKLINKYAIYTDPDKAFPHIASIEKPKYSTGFLEITAFSYNKSELRTILTKSVSAIQEDHNTSFQAYIKNQKNVLTQSNDIIEMMQKQISQLKINNEQLDTQLKGLDNNQLALIAIKTVTIIKNETEIIRLEEKEIRQVNFSKSLTVTLDPTRTFNTKLINGINIHPKPITPSKKIIIIVGFISGILLGLLLSFFLSFLAKRRE